MGFIDFLDGNILDEVGLDMMMRQGVMRFSTTAQLSSDLGSGIREAGMMAYADDTQTVYMWDGTNWIPWFSAEKTASVAFTAGGTNITVGNSTVVSKYRVVGGQCFWSWHFTIGSTANMQSGNLAIGLPMSVHNDQTNGYLGHSTFWDVSASTTYHRAFVNVSNQNNGAWVDSNGTRWSTTSPTTFATGDILMLNAKYRVSSSYWLS